MPYSRDKAALAACRASYLVPYVRTFDDGSFGVRHFLWDTAAAEWTASRRCCWWP